MKVVEKAINVRDYYKMLKEDYNKSLNDAEKNLKASEKSNVTYYNRLKECAPYIKKEFGINLDNYEEFVENKHIDGTLHNTIVKFHRNAKNEIAIRYSIIMLKYSQSIENIHNHSATIEKCKTILAFTYKQYTAFLKQYYYEVQRQMIVNGYAYEFMGRTGTICINRCKNLKRKPIIDTKATKANAERLKDQGIELYNEQKAAYCADHGIEYKGVEYKIFKRNEYLYEFVLIFSGLPNAFKHKFEPIDYWGANLRGKTKEDFKKEANGNLNYICNLDITFRTKVTICNEMDETLYLNFIRNEHQTPITASKNYR